jgi:predicted amidohydrolase YtcJ
MFFLSSRITLAALCAVLWSAPAATGQKVKADIVYLNGRFITLDSRDRIVDAVAIKNGRFIQVGSIKAVEALIGPRTQKIDLQGKTVVPGLIDAHTHPMETVFLKEEWVNARYPGVPSIAMALNRIKERVNKSKPGEWIFVAAVSSSQTKFSEKRLPSKAELDGVAPQNPVVFANGAHMAVVNSTALKALNITKGTTRLPKGGGVLLDDAGEPTGVLTDSQADVPANPSLPQLERYYTKSIQDLWNSYGFTSVMAITPAAALPVLQAVSTKQVQPNIRYTISVWTTPDASETPKNVKAFEMPKKADPNFYRFAALKDWVDGENDCRTGYMYEPYVGHQDTDPPGNKGSLVTPLKGTEQLARIAARNGKMAMLHCSGDAATDIGLDTFEDMNKKGYSKSLKRIEHFGMFQLSDKQLARAQALKKDHLHINVQPIWMLALAEANIENMGRDRAMTGMRFGTLVKAGLEPSAGTDMTGLYLENLDPIKAIYAAVTRQSSAGVFLPEEAISPKDALRMWTIWAARSIGDGTIKGSIEVGKLADLTVLSDDITTINPQAIKDVSVLRTIVGGRTVYSKP